MLRSLSLFFTCLIIAFTASSQRIDATFQPKLVTYGYVFDATPLPDGKAIITGDFDYVNGVQVGGIARMNTNGELDVTFQTGVGAEGGDYVQSVARYPDGKLLVYGTFSKFNGKAAAGIVRLNADGTFDNTFTSSFTGTVGIFSVGIQSTGKIVVASVSVAPGTLPAYTLTRLNADGTRDNTFQGGISGSQRISRVVVLANDKIIAGGWFSAYGGVATANNLVRLNADGTLDNTFNANLTGDLNNTVAEIDVMADGKIFIGRNIKVTKLNSDGSPDNSFAPVTPITGFVSMTVLSDGSVVVAQQIGLVKYSATGAVVTQVAIDSFAGSVYNLGNDRLLTGFQDPAKSHNLRDANLAIDNSWTPAMILSLTTEYNLSGGFKVFKQGEKFLVRTYADFFSTGSITDLHPVDGIFRLNSDFTFDNTFHYTPTDYKDVMITYVDGTGRIYVQQTRSGVRAIERLSADGADDNTFTRIPGLFNDLDEIDGENLVAVEWDYTNTTGHLRKFNTSGTIDNSLNVSSVGQMQTIDVASDGKWYIYLTEWNIGAGLKINGTTVKSIARLNADGTVDSNFNFPSVINALFKIDTQDTRLVAAGGITRPQVGTAVAIERWTTTGATDLQQGDAIRNIAGHDFMIKGDYYYVITYGSPRFEVKRVKMTGEVDKLFAPVNYRNAEQMEIVSSNPDRIYSLSDNSILVIGNGVYKIDILAPANGPSALAASVAGNAEVSLTWTDNGPDEAVFELERAEGDGAFTLLATLDANTITYKDNTAADGKSYRYRIRGVNAGGASAYSNVAETGLITGIGETGIDLSFYPNPVKDYIHIQSKGVVHAFSLRQVDGRLVEAANPGSNEFKINMTNYSSGLYLLQLDGTNNRRTIKIFKQ